MLIVRIYVTTECCVADRIKFPDEAEWMDRVLDLIHMVYAGYAENHTTPTHADEHLTNEQLRNIIYLVRLSVRRNWRVSLSVSGYSAH